MSTKNNVLEKETIKTTQKIVDVTEKTKEKVTPSNDGEIDKKKKKRKKNTKKTSTKSNTSSTKTLVVLPQNDENPQETLTEFNAQQEKDLTKSNAQENNLTEPNAQQKEDLTEFKVQQEDILMESDLQQEQNLTESNIQQEDNLMESDLQQEQDLTESNAQQEDNLMESDLQQEKNLTESNIQPEDNSATTFQTVPKESTDVLSIFTLLVVGFIGILLLIFAIFTIYNTFNTNIISGVHIKGVDVSGLSESDAKYQLDNYLKSFIPEEIKIKHDDFETTISTSQMEISFDTKSASHLAFQVGREGNIFENNIRVLSMMFGYINIEPNITFNKELLTKYLEDISTQLPDAVVQSSYYIENNELIITSGKEGNVVDINSTIEAIKSSISTFSSSENPIEIAVKNQQPNEINIEQIYNEIRKDPVDAYYTTDPFEIYPSENGLDFNISLEEAKNIISSEEKEEYSIPLNIITPNVTTNMIGTEAFPDLLSTFSTRYAASNRNRTTNLILAANKINGTVLMPGETFSYNKVVGARTIAAGYKEAPIYIQGRVEDGLGGGICQITSTLYNAVIYANLEITQRTNHQFVPSYVTASRDATVVYGALDFQFKNNRNYPIKLVCSVSGGIANFQIFGMRQEDDVEVEISSYETGRTSTAIYSEAYKILKRDGQIIDTQLLSKDTYRRH